MVTALSMESLAHVLEKTLLEKVATKVRNSREKSSELLSVVVPLLKAGEEDSESYLSLCQALCLKMLSHCQVVKVQVDIHGSIELEVLAEEKVA